MKSHLVQTLSITIVPLILSIIGHEVAHAYTAYLLGDKTAKYLGRLSFNPLRHLDLVGTVILPIVSYLAGNMIIGWAKPVPIDPRNLKNPRWSFALISVAGPAANFLMAFLWALFGKIGLLLYGVDFPGAEGIVHMGSTGLWINVVLGLLNMLPIPPLDGGHFLASLVPPKWTFLFSKMEQYGFFIIMILCATGIFGKIIDPLARQLFAMFTYLVALSPL